MCAAGSAYRLAPGNRPSSSGYCSAGLSLPHPKCRPHLLGPRCSAAAEEAERAARQNPIISCQRTCESHDIGSPVGKWLSNCLAGSYSFAYHQTTFAKDQVRLSRFPSPPYPKPAFSHATPRPRIPKAESDSILFWCQSIWRHGTSLISPGTQGGYHLAMLMYSPQLSALWISFIFEIAKVIRHYSDCFAYTCRRSFRAVLYKLRQSFMFPALAYCGMYHPSICSWHEIYFTFFTPFTRPYSPFRDRL
jgi:hypothetical protein